MTIRTRVILAASLISLASVSAFAQDASTLPAGSQPAVEHQKLTPEQKTARKEERKEAMQSMTPDQRKEARAARQAKRQQRYDNATPEQKAKMDARKQQHEANRQAKRAAKGNTAAQ